MARKCHQKVSITGTIPQNCATNCIQLSHKKAQESYEKPLEHQMKHKSTTENNEWHHSVTIAVVDEILCVTLTGITQGGTQVKNCWRL